jgi:hypothetical protein
MTPVLAGSRKRPFRSKLAEGESLPDALVRHVGAGVITVDLEQEPDTREDIAGYVRKRCEAEGVDGENVAWALANRATQQDGGFLFARLVTGFLISEIRSTADEESIDGGELVARLPGSVEAAFEEDLRSGPARVRDDGAVLPSAARDLLTALAWAAGRGMPAGGVWETVASALAGHPTDAVYDEEDVDWVLSEYGRYVVEDSEGSQAVYRLYHREFVNHLRRREPPEGPAATEVVLRAIVRLLRQQASKGNWEAVDPYVREWLATHAGWAGGPGPGIDVLRELVAWDRDNALPHLASTLQHCAIDLSRSGRRDLAVEFSREGVEIYSGLADSAPATYLPHVASALNDVAIHLAEAGERQAALESAEEAVRIYTGLADSDPTAYRPELATALNTLASRMAEAGRREAALEPARAAVRIRRPLAEANPAAHLPELAQSLNNLAIHLAEAGEQQDALEPAREAVRIYAGLADSASGMYLPHLAGALDTLASRMAEAGDREAALEPARAAVRIHRPLAEANPAAHLPGLAQFLNNLAIRLAATGNRHGALEPADEAVRILTGLADAHPAAHLPDLALALSNLATRLADTGARQAALEPAREAVRIRRTLADADPAAHLPDLATALSTLAARLGETGDQQAALEAAQEAVRIRRTLADAHPAAYLPKLARALNNLAIQLSETGDQQAALDTAHEAVRVYTELADTNPAAYLPSLAMALSTLATGLGEAGDQQAALRLAQEAVRIHTELADTNPAAHLPNLAGSLTNLANHLAGTGDQQAALDTAHEAVRVYTGLADAHPEAHLPDLAMALHNLAVHLSEAGDPQAALDPIREAVRIRRTLADADPSAHLPDLADSLTNLADHLGETEGRRAALEPAQEALLIRTGLVTAYPAVHLSGFCRSLNALARHLAESGQESAAVQAYTDAAAGLAQDHPAAARTIEYMFAVFQLSLPAPTSEAGLRGLIRLLRPGPERPDQVSLWARQDIRSYARETFRNKDALERIWSQETNALLPDWVSLPQRTEDLVVAWMDTPTWEESQEFWAEHADVLTSEAASTALEELNFITPVAGQHLDIRERILSEGAASVFHELTLHDRLADWLACETWGASQRFLQENRELFLDGSAEQMLLGLDPLTPRKAALAAVLYLARNEEIDTAYRCVQDRDVLQRHVLQAVREGDVDALRHAAAIEGAVFHDVPSCTAHSQAAALLGRALDALDPDALAQATADADPATRTRLTAELATLSTRHGGEHMAHWMSLIEALNRSA